MSPKYKAIHIKPLKRVIITLFGQKVFADVIRLRIFGLPGYLLTRLTWGSYVFLVDEFPYKRHREEEQQGDCGDRDWCDANASQGMPAAARAREAQRGAHLPTPRC